MPRKSLRDLEPGANFIRRHIGPSDAEIAEMLSLLGVSSLDDFIDRAVPKKLHTRRPLDLPPPKAERTALSYLRSMAERNEVYTSMIGMGYYGTITPKVILRNVLENPGWYTAYTPYQAEVSQGRLEALLNFQQMTIDLPGLSLPTPRSLMKRPLPPRPWRCRGASPSPLPMPSSSIGTPTRKRSVSLKLAQGRSALKSRSAIL
jgi:hypothetical protein